MFFEIFLTFFKKFFIRRKYRFFFVLLDFSYARVYNNIYNIKGAKRYAFIFTNRVYYSFRPLRWGYAYRRRARKLGLRRTLRIAHAPVLGVITFMQTKPCDEKSSQRR